MNGHERSAAVTSGYYLEVRTMRIALVERDGGRLPDGAGRWIAIPALAALALTPLLGALLLAFLPVIGFVLCGEAMARRIAMVLTGGAGELAGAVAPGWIPGEAHLSGAADRRHGAKDTVDPLDLRLAELEREIERRRGLAA